MIHKIYQNFKDACFPAIELIESYVLNFFEAYADNLLVREILFNYRLRLESDHFWLLSMSALNL